MRWCNAFSDFGKNILCNGAYWYGVTRPFLLSKMCMWWGPRPSWPTTQHHIRTTIEQNTVSWIRIVLLEGLLKVQIEFLLSGTLFLIEIVHRNQPIPPRKTFFFLYRTMIDMILEHVYFKITGSNSNTFFFLWTSHLPLPANHLNKKRIEHQLQCHNPILVDRITLTGRR